MIARGTAGGREPVGLFLAIDFVVHLLLNETSYGTRDDTAVCWSERRCHAYHHPHSHAYHHPRSNKQIAIQDVPDIIRIWHITRTWYNNVLYIRPKVNKGRRRYISYVRSTWYLVSSTSVLALEGGVNCNPSSREVILEDGIYLLLF